MQERIVSYWEYRRKRVQNYKIKLNLKPKEYLLNNVLGLVKILWKCNNITTMIKKIKKNPWYLCRQIKDIKTVHWKKVMDVMEQYSLLNNTHDSQQIRILNIIVKPIWNCVHIAITLRIRHNLEIFFFQHFHYYETRHFLQSMNTSDRHKAISYSGFIVLQWCFHQHMAQSFKINIFQLPLVNKYKREPPSSWKSEVISELASVG